RGSPCWLTAAVCTVRGGAGGGVPAPEPAVGAGGAGVIASTRPENAVGPRAGTLFGDAAGLTGTWQVLPRRHRTSARSRTRERDPPRPAPTLTTPGAPRPAAPPPAPPCPPSERRRRS